MYDCYKLDRVRFRRRWMRERVRTPQLVRPRLIGGGKDFSVQGSVAVHGLGPGLGHPCRLQSSHGCLHPIHPFPPPLPWQRSRYLNLDQTVHGHLHDAGAAELDKFILGSPILLQIDAYLLLWAVSLINGVVLQQSFRYLFSV